MKGLIQRGEIWYFKKKLRGIPEIRGSSDTSDKAEAEMMLQNRIVEARRIYIHGGNPVVTFSEAIEKFVREKHMKKSIKRDIQAFETLKPYIGRMDIANIHMGSLEEYLSDRMAAGIKNVTINRDLSPLRQVLNRAARVWRHPNNRPYLESAPLIETLDNDARPPYPLTMEEQQRILSQMSKPHADYALFLVNTGLRKKEGLALEWGHRIDWGNRIDVDCPAAFLLPATSHKNKQPRIVPLNSIAQSIVREQTAETDSVFSISQYTFRYQWERARDIAGLPHIRVHDLKHTFGTRLRNAGVDYTDRQDLLGHKKRSVTDHYSAPDISRLVAESEAVVGLTAEPVLRAIGNS